MDAVSQFVAAWAPQIGLALVVLVVGWWLIGKVVNLTVKAMEKNELDVTLQRFLSSIIGIGLKALLIISVASMVGIATTSFIAVLGAAGLAVGLALQGSLSNFAGGVLLILFKPYKVGDFIETQGHAGVVQSIQIFNTILKTGDNKTIIIPNGPISNGSITNYSTEATRRVDMSFGIGYDDDIDGARAALEEIIAADDRILKDPAHLIVVAELADSSVNFTVRVWVNSADYWGVFFAMQEQVKKTFDAKEISIPYPQQDVHLHKVD
ncbi:mechanosensitive ion channel family protein [Pseudoteredinibacter isoporae]|uniref:Small-conductance mechanosensitive channel n=1 Tax=Pseudoteredinibacter isoporae TaxID=570281 RepID=A0A7X0MTU5_9GAMM|nr:mechanosensitive ion channel domain-containing protein [Pseudoteredinibacter isoporae]MBB6519916.1 small conductance mechanosensitive channel [Pseudoteredinibacter isoporae]NHO85492.1 mechanosensitive ion channel [Pseudoteredinibacter isoporae]NIB26056.1 mechanosensitive ion channel [Pseudoteredinibacter isoporae]